MTAPMPRRFRSYARRWIRHQITGALERQARTIRLPRYVLETLRKLERTRDALVQELGREPTDGEVGERLDLSATKVRRLLGLAREPLSLEGLIEAGGVGPARDRGRGAVSPIDAVLDAEVSPRSTGRWTSCRRARRGCSACASG